MSPRLALLGFASRINMGSSVALLLVAHHTPSQVGATEIRFHCLLRAVVTLALAAGLRPPSQPPWSGGLTSVFVR